MIYMYVYRRTIDYSPKVDMSNSPAIIEHIHFGMRIQYNIIYQYKGKKRKQNMIYTVMWLNHAQIILPERSQTKKKVNTVKFQLCKCQKQ